VTGYLLVTLQKYGKDLSYLILVGFLWMEYEEYTGE